MKNLFYLQVLFVLGIIISCYYGNEKDELSLKRKPYVGNEMRLDGYYYRITESNNMQIYFFYRNGVILHGGDISKLSEYETLYRNGQYYTMVSNDEVSWGVFHIDSDTITFERWYPGDYGWVTYIRMGGILNDTTFHISSSYRSDESESRSKDETYHFRAFSPKPDSTCPFIP